MSTPLSKIAKNARQMIRDGSQSLPDILSQAIESMRPLEPEVAGLLQDLNKMLQPVTIKLELPLTKFLEPLEYDEYDDDLPGDSELDERDPKELRQLLDRELDEISKSRDEALKERPEINTQALKNIRGETKMSLSVTEIRNEDEKLGEVVKAELMVEEGWKYFWNIIQSSFKILYLDRSIESHVERVVNAELQMFGVPPEGLEAVKERIKTEAVLKLKKFDRDRRVLRIYTRLRRSARNAYLRGNVVDDVRHPVAIHWYHQRINQE